MRVRAGALLGCGALLLVWLAWRRRPARVVRSRETPLIFIGGAPRSGTTLMRAVLDAHPDVRCGQETFVVPHILQMRQLWSKSQEESLRLKEAGIDAQVLDNAIASFCLEVFVRHGEPAPHLCNEDPFMLKIGAYVLNLFPNAKFLFMVRDGRATVHSIISRQETIIGFDLTSYRQCMTKWNAAIQALHEQCNTIGSDRCLLVHYEQLVLQPRQQLERVLSFLDVPWHEAVLHPDQVMKPVNLKNLSKWVGHIPADVVADMAQLAPMLSVLGYDPWADPPRYGDNMRLLARHDLRLLRDARADRLLNKTWPYRTDAHATRNMH